MTAVLLVVGLIIVAAIALAIGGPAVRGRRRTVVVERDVPATTVRHVRTTPVVRQPVVEEVIEERY